MAEEKEKPLTREDVIRLIEENGEKAEGLDLSGKRFDEGIDLSNLDLSGIILKGATFPVLSYGAKRMGARFDGSDLTKADLRDSTLEEASFNGTKLEGAFIGGADITDAQLGRIDWGSYKIGEEICGDFYSAEHRYRRLKMLYTESGYYNTAGRFFYREMELKRKILKWWPNPLPRAWSKFVSLICGYGERPFRLVALAAVIIFGLAAAYYFLGSFSSSSFWDTLYYSAASFTALGYGQWAPQPTGWAKGMGAGEAIIGVFIIALFLVTFVRKMTR